MMKERKARAFIEGPETDRLRNIYFNLIGKRNLDESDCEWLCRLLEQILMQEDVRDRFFDRRRGPRVDDAGSERAFECAVTIAELSHPRKSKRLSIEKATEVAAERHRMSFEQARRAWLKDKEIARFMADGLVP